MSNQQHETDTPRHKHTNRLINETSPYLLQHAHNPVDWYPWGDEAFAKATREDKPVFLSVGYAACHWCHVMAHESFENEDTARLMNDNFVNIKVDREERPDVDALYMDAVQALTGGGGWPMSVFLTPDGAPFFGGTYFPPEERYGMSGMPSFPRLLHKIAALYCDQRDDVDRQADEFRTFYRERGQVRLTLPENIQPSSAVVNPSVLFQAADRLIAQMDPIEGGFGRAPKFPHPMGLEFLLRVASRTHPAYPENAPLLQLLRLTLDKMADGGIYDQIGGGFHRYSTDTYWLVPHFEKMLYDNALLASVYLHAWQLTGESRYRRVCEETLDYVLREMTDPSGGFYSTQDADSEGKEGKFYIWTPTEIRAILGEEVADIVEDLWGISERGNFEGRNILHVARPAATIAAEHDMSASELDEVISSARARLYKARAARVWPARDDKVLAAWNGFTLRALAEAGRALDRDDFRQAAIRNATFITTEMMPDGQLRRSWRKGQARLSAYLEDYASIINGLLTTFELTGDIKVFASARALANTMIERFWDAGATAFFDTAHDAEQLIGRPRELMDNATPSGTSLAAEALLRLAAFTGEDRYRELAVRVVVPLAPAMADSPSAFGHLLCALDDFVGPFQEVAVVGTPGSADRATLLAPFAQRFLPRLVLAQAASGDRDAVSAVPLLAGRGLINGRATAYVCEHFVCQQPVTDPEALLALIQP